jgi:hypothetical protein
MKNYVVGFTQRAPKTTVKINRFESINSNNKNGENM